MYLSRLQKGGGEGGRGGGIGRGMGDRRCVFGYISKSLNNNILLFRHAERHTLEREKTVLSSRSRSRDIPQFVIYIPFVREETSLKEPRARLESFSEGKKETFLCVKIFLTSLQ